MRNDSLYMRISTNFGSDIAMMLLIITLLLVGVSKGENNPPGVAPGGCPIPLHPLIKHCGKSDEIDQCSSDSDCLIGYRCCDDGCSLKCTEIVPEKLGTCPSQETGVKCGISVSHQCTKDYQCFGKLKCCQTPCGSRCVNPDPAVCPTTPDKSTIICSKEHVDLCKKNSDCEFNRKCCDVGCNKICTIYKPKPGQCPLPRDPKVTSCPADSTDQCKLDNECPLDQKCCNDPCGKICSPVDVLVKDIPIVKSCSSVYYKDKCPYFYNACMIDEHCPYDYVCCSTKCGKRCEGTLPPPPPPTTTTAKPKPVLKKKCPHVISRGFCFSVDYCYSDDRCAYGLKCCPTHCGKRCLRPLVYIDHEK